MLERTPAGSWANQGTPIEIDPAEKKTIRILVVDDERTLRESCASILETENFPVTVTGKADEAREILRRIRPEIVLVDLYMPEISGMELLELALEANPDALVIVMTGKATVESSVEALRAGAWSYIPKPFSATHLSILIGRAAHAVTIGRESRKLKESPDPADKGGPKIELLGASPAFEKMLQAARQVASTDASVFISGESGTGKELVAQFIHQHSRRTSRELVSINSAAIPENLLESEMFGHVQGAFTGAVRDKKGLLESANGGTLFLDEVNEMPHPIQAKLLRVIQDGVVRRVGSVSVDAVVDVRFIAATNQDPGEAVRSGKLRADLHYRLRVFPIHIPPLRERPDDIPVLANFYLNKFWKTHRAAGSNEPTPTLTDEAIRALQSRHWSGNVRELRNVMEHTVVILPEGAETVEPGILPFLDHEGVIDGVPPGAQGLPLGLSYHDAREHVLTNFEREYFTHVVKRAKGNLSDAARFAEVDRTTLYRLMEKHELRREDLLKLDDS
jgi:DNA-binding NtrC family response regulator